MSLPRSSGLPRCKLTIDFSRDLLLFSASFIWARYVFQNPQTVLSFKSGNCDLNFRTAVLQPHSLAYFAIWKRHLDVYFVSLLFRVDLIDLTFLLTAPCVTAPNPVSFIIGKTCPDWSFAIRIKINALKLKCTAWSFHLLGS